MVSDVPGFLQACDEIVDQSTLEETDSPTLLLIPFSALIRTKILESKYKVSSGCLHILQDNEMILRADGKNDFRTEL